MEDLATLKQRMLDAHPDRQGGSHEAFIKARAEYNRKLKPHKQCFYCKVEHPIDKMRYLGFRVAGDAVTRKHGDFRVFSCEQCLTKRAKIRS